MDRRHEMRAHLDSKDRDGQHGRNEGRLTQTDQFALAGLPFAIDGGAVAFDPMRLVARATDRRLQILERGDAGEVAHADPLSRENDRRCIDSRNGLYRLLDMGDAGRARHSRYTQLDRHFRHAIARAFDSANDRGGIRLARESNFGALGGQVDAHLCHVRQLGDSLFHMGNARRAGHSLNGTAARRAGTGPSLQWNNRSEEHTSELQSLMRISYAVFCLKKKKTNIKITTKLNKA